MVSTPVQADLALLAERKGHTAPTLSRESTEALREIAEFLKRCDIGEFSALAMLMKLTVERGTASDGKDRWPVEALNVALNSSYDLGWSRQKLWFSLIEISGMGLHTMALNSPEIAYYEEQQRTDRSVLTSASPTDRLEYQELKSAWQQQVVELDQLLLHRENTLLQREAVRQSFLRRFPLYIEEREQKLRLAVAEIKLAALRDNPLMSKEELEEVSSAELRRAADGLRDDHRSMDYALNAEGSSLGATATQQALTAFRKRLRTLFMILHPDRLLHVPLTEHQRAELRRLWDDCHAVNVKNATKYDLIRSSELIEMSIERAKAILSLAGIDIDPTLIIRGETLEERIIWLQKSLHRTRRDIEIVRDELKAWRDDQEISAMAVLLGQSSEQQREQHDAMRCRAREIEAEAVAAEANLREILARRHAG